MKSVIVNQKSEILYSIFTLRNSFLVLMLSFVVCGLFIAKDTSAQASMSNGTYIIRWPNLNSFSGRPSNDEYKLGITGGQTAPGLYSGSGYKIRSGFQYIVFGEPFSFSISSNFIDFGPLTPGAPVTRTNTLTISNRSAYGYQVLASENHPLRSFAIGDSIPDTTCDSGTCTESNADAWANLTTFGFGYRCDNVSGTDCGSGFTDNTYYKQFASSESAELAQPVMSGTNVGENIQSQITYKVNISTTQRAGQYQNYINFVAFPSI